MSERKKAITAVVSAIAALLIAVALLAWWAVALQKKLHTPAEPVVVTDTIVNWQYDTIYRTNTRVVKLPVHDTTVCVDSIYATDSVFVDVPIYRYIYDTTLTDTHAVTRLQLTLSGYAINVDTLVTSSTITPIVITEKIPWYKRFRPSVGVGIGTTFKGQATVGVYAGVGYLF